MAIFASILEREAGKLRDAQRRVFAKVAGPLAAGGPDYAADARVLGDFLRGTEPPPPAKP